MTFLPPHEVFVSSRPPAPLRDERSTALPKEGEKETHHFNLFVSWRQLNLIIPLLDAGGPAPFVAPERQTRAFVEAQGRYGSGT